MRRQAILPKQQQCVCAGGNRFEGNRKSKYNKEVEMETYECVPCGYVYDPAEGDPENGVEPGTAFEDVPDDWQCPICFADKDQFEKVEE